MWYRDTAGEKEETVLGLKGKGRERLLETGDREVMWTGLLHGNHDLNSWEVSGDSKSMGPLQRGSPGQTYLDFILLPPTFC